MNYVWYGTDFSAAHRNRRCYVGKYDRIYTKEHRLSPTIRPSVVQNLGLYLCAEKNDGDLLIYSSYGYDSRIVYLLCRVESYCHSCVSQTSGLVYQWTASAYFVWFDLLKFEVLVFTPLCSLVKRTDELAILSGIISSLDMCRRPHIQTDISSALACMIVF